MNRWILPVFVAVAVGIAIWVAATTQESVPAQQGSVKEPTEKAPRFSYVDPDLATISLTGRVVNEQGEALTDADIYPGRRDWQTRGTTPSPSGWFTLKTYVRPGTRLCVTCPGYVPWISPLLEAINVNTLEHATLGEITLRRANIISGVLLYEDGEPIPDIEIEAVAEHIPSAVDALAYWWTGAGAATDKQGRFRIDEVPFGIYTVLAGSHFLNGRFAEGVRSGRSDVVIRMPRGPKREVSAVRVQLATEDGSPVPMCDSALIWPSGWDRKGEATDDEIHFDPVPAGDYRLDVIPRDTAYARQRIRVSTRAPIHRVTLRPSVNLGGHVRHKGEGVETTVTATGFMRSNGSITATKDDETTLRVSRHVRSSADGSFRFEGMSAGTVQLSAVSKYLRSVASDGPRSTSATNYIIQMEDRPLLAVRIHAEEGDHLDQWTVRFVQESIRHLLLVRAPNPPPSGSPRVSAIAECVVEDENEPFIAVAYNVSKSTISESSELRLRAGGDLQDLHLKSRAPLTVRVVDPSGKPIEGALVELRRPSRESPTRLAQTRHRPQSRYGGGYTDRLGVCRLARRQPLGSWCVLAYGIDTSQRGRLPRVEDDELEVEVVLHKGVSLSGAVRGTLDRNSEIEMYAYAHPLDGQQEAIVTQHIGLNGRFHFTNLAPGRYVVACELQEPWRPKQPLSAWWVSGPVEAGRPGLRGTFQTGHLSTVTLRNESDARISSARVMGNDLIRTLHPDGSGVFHVAALMPGEYTFEITDSDGNTHSTKFTAGKPATLHVK